MTVDDTKLAYYSGWDIDQLVANDVVNVGSGDTAIYTVPSNLSLPMFEVQFKPSGAPGWYLPGNNSTDGTLAGQFHFSAYEVAGVIHIVTSTAGQARYFVWKDTIVY